MCVPVDSRSACLEAKCVCAWPAKEVRPGLVIPGPTLRNISDLPRSESCLGPRQGCRCVEMDPLDGLDTHCLSAGQSWKCPAGQGGRPGLVVLGPTLTESSDRPRSESFLWGVSGADGSKWTHWTVWTRSACLEAKRGYASPRGKARSSGPNT